MNQPQPADPQIFGTILPNSIIIQKIIHAKTHRIICDSSLSKVRHVRLSAWKNELLSIGCSNGMSMKSK